MPQKIFYCKDILLKIFPKCKIAFLKIFEANSYTNKWENLAIYGHLFASFVWRTSLRARSRNNLFKSQNKLGRDLFWTKISYSCTKLRILTGWLEALWLDHVVGLSVEFQPITEQKPAKHKCMTKKFFIGFGLAWRFLFNRLKVHKGWPLITVTMNK